MPSKPLYSFAAVTALSLNFSSALHAQATPSAVTDLAMEIGQTETISEELGTALDTLQAAIDMARSGNAASTIRALNGTASRIDALNGNLSIATAVETLRQSIVAYQEDTPFDHLSKLARTMNDRIDPEAVENPADLRNDFDELYLKLRTLNAQRPLAAAQDRADDLNTLINETDALKNGEIRPGQFTDLLNSLRDTQLTFYRTALNDRIASLDEVLGLDEEVRSPLTNGDIKALRDLSAKIADALPEEDTRSRMTSQAVVLTETLDTPEAKALTLKPTDTATLTALIAAADALLDRKPRGLHVIGATFGRLPGAPGSGGQCNVTAIMRAKCEGLAECSWPEDGVKSFCGGVDPAPFIPSQYRGVHITYACIDASKDDWNALLAGQQVALNPPAIQQRANLRSKDDKVLCRTVSAQ
ncbi:hypothetical protein [uncultured Roseobacter sp.]|uniref:hypothetical protein n=1 Tax=uncultured Roseobacter sp. TaxID=114847 RepID=UPI00262F7116|nr:hypothetical protein [uncultured Roseobacter sp.]